MHVELCQGKEHHADSVMLQERERDYWRGVVIVDVSLVVALDVVVFSAVMVRGVAEKQEIWVVVAYGFGEKIITDVLVLREVRLRLSTYTDLDEGDSRWQYRNITGNGRSASPIHGNNACQ